MSNETDLDWLARNVHVWNGICNYATLSGGQCYFHQYRPAIANSITREQWLARRAELQSKPGWESAPEWASWLCQDSNGFWWFFRFEPEVAGSVWDSDNSAFHHSSWVAGEVLGDWRDTLEKRPEEFKPSIGNVTMFLQNFKKPANTKDNQECDMKQDNGWFERGELPPVGSNVTIVEIDGFGISDLGREFIGDECKVMATFIRPAVFHGDEAKVVAVMGPDGGCCCFRLEMVKPIRTEREQLTSIIDGGKRVLATPEAIADAILAAGFSLRVK